MVHAPHQGRKNPMGKKLGNALIIYGVLNFFASFALGNPIIVLGALIWMIILIFLGTWQRSKRKIEKDSDKPTEAQFGDIMRLDDKEREKLR
jgi:hypothetical protein